MVLAVGTIEMEGEHLVEVVILGSLNPLSVLLSKIYTKLRAPNTWLMIHLHHPILTNTYTTEYHLPFSAKVV